MEAARRLEDAGDNGADHIWLWNQCLTYLARAEQLDPNLSFEERHRVAAKALLVAPDDSVANTTWGIVLLAWIRPRKAEHLNRALIRAGPKQRRFIQEVLHDGYATSAMAMERETLWLAPVLARGNASTPAPADRAWREIPHQRPQHPR